MAKTLIIVESPGKIKTLKNILGDNYMVEASVGHVRDLPAREIGVDVEHDFKPKYTNLATRKDVIKKLVDAAKKASSILIASDNDREGEAIGWHISQALKIENPKRVVFNAITKADVQAGISNPRDLNMPKVDAQEARRILDRLVGYRISPLLWKKVAKNLSAGIVQSVAVRLVVDREREILAFVPVEYWSLTANLTPVSPQPNFPFDAKLVARDGKKYDLTNETDTNTVLTDLENANYQVASVKASEKRRNPSAPFITSTLQQEASRKLGYGSKRTMSIAQGLYEGVELGSQGAVGLITYMRTDSVRIADEAQIEAKEFITKQYGAEFAPASAKQFKTKGAAQDAHEAVRPTSVFRTPDSIKDYLKPEQLKLYRLIWMRFVASQMTPAVFDVTTAEINASRYTFRATGSVIKFAGFTVVYTEGKDTEETSDEEKDPLPALSADQPLDLIELLPKQHFTEPPPRFSEATLVKALVEHNIGRPSTFASIVSTIVDREYVELLEKRFHPTELGITVNDLLVKHFPDILNIAFTADMESKLDEVENGTADKVQLLRDFYGPFDASVALAHEQMERVKPVQVETEFTCPNCGKMMMLRKSRFGEFLGCSGYPKCKTVLNVDGTPREAEAKAEPIVSDQVCPKCGKPLYEREGRFGKFLGCSGYPKCKTIVNLPGQEGDKPAGVSVNTGIKCPKDDGEIIAKKTRFGALYLCSNNPTCDFKSWGRPVGRPCPTCTWPLAESTYKGKPTGKLKCCNPDCSYEEKAEPSALADAGDG
ncbi:MAG: type I DNA topoisomerase [Chthonomonadales bacterium]